MFQFMPLPPNYLLIVGEIVFIYVMTAELVKRVFYRHVNGDAPVPAAESEAVGR
jgi:hypothetical protein